LPEFGEDDWIARCFVELITRCWHNDPSMRPDFGTIVEVLQSVKQFHARQNDGDDHQTTQTTENVVASIIHMLEPSRPIIEPMVNYTITEREHVVCSWIHKAFVLSSPSRIHCISMVKQWSNRWHSFVGPHIIRVGKEMETKECTQILGGARDGCVHVWEMDSGKLVHSISAHNKRVNAMAVINDHLWSCGDDGLVCVCDTQEMKVVQKLKEHTKPVLCLCWNKERNWILSGGEDSKICVWDATTMQMQFQVTCKAEVLSLVVFPHLVWVGTTCGIDIYSLKEREMTHEIHVGSNKDVVKQLIVVDERVWAACNYDIHIWDVDKKTGHPLKLEATLKPQLGRVDCLCQVGMFVLGSFWSYPEIVLWNSKTFDYVATLLGNENQEPTRRILMVDETTMCTTCYDQAAPAVVWKIRAK